MTVALTLSCHENPDRMIAPAHSLRRGQLFLVTVTDFAATPTVPDPAVFAGAPFFRSPDGTGWAFPAQF